MERMTQGDMWFVGMLLLAMVALSGRLLHIYTREDGTEGLSNQEKQAVFVLRNQMTKLQKGDLVLLQEKWFQIQNASHGGYLLTLQSVDGNQQEIDLGSTKVAVKMWRDTKRIVRQNEDDWPEKSVLFP